MVFMTSHKNSLNSRMSVFGSWAANLPAGFHREVDVVVSLGLATGVALQVAEPSVSVSRGLAGLQFVALSALGLVGRGSALVRVAGALALLFAWAVLPRPLSLGLTLVAWGWAQASALTPAAVLRSVVGVLLGAAWYAVVAKGLLGARHPALTWAAVALPLTSGAFLMAGRWLSHLRTRGDTLALEAATLPLLWLKGVALWRRIEAVRQALPRGPARSTLSALSLEVLARAVALARQHEDIARHLEGLGVEEAREAWEALKRRAAEQADPFLKGELERAARLQSDCLEQLSGLEREQGRLAARVDVELAMLERTAVAVELTSRAPARLLETLARLSDAQAALVTANRADPVALTAS